MQPKVSIITVVYNNRQSIEDAIKSVFSQTYKNIEYILIDGASTDGTKEVINKYRDQIAVYVSEKDNGIYHAMNKGIKLSSGEIIGFLNSDDIYASDAIVDRVVKELQEKQSGSCYGDLVYVKKDDTEKTIRYWKSEEYQESLLKKGWIPPHPTFFVKKRVYDQHGLFDLSFNLAADYEIMFRFLYKNRIKTTYIPDVLVKMRSGGATNKNIINIIMQNLEIIRVLRINGLFGPEFLFFKVYDRLKQFIS